MTTVERIRFAARVVESKWHADLALRFLGNAFASIAIQMDLDAYNARREAAFQAAFQAEYAEEIAALASREACTVVGHRVAA